MKHIAAIVMAGTLFMLVACSDGQSENAEAGSGGESAASELRICDELALLAAPDDWYRGEPVYEGNEMPVEEVRAWAATQPGFEEIWIDRERNGWVSVAFSSGAADRQADIEELFAGEGVVAVAVDYTMDELVALQEQVTEALPAREWGMGSGIQPQHGVVTIHLGVLSDDRLEVVADEFGDDPVCVEGADPDTVIPEGPQPESGDGWRLLADQRTGEPYRTGIAASPEGYAELWLEAGLEGEPPEVDFETEVVVWFGAVYSGSCPDIRLDDVVIEELEGEPSILHAEIVRPGPPQAACTADANPRAYLVALQRDRLPAPTYHLQLRADDPPRGVPEERTVVSADLREPGTALGPDDTGPDPELPGHS